MTRRFAQLPKCMYSAPMRWLYSICGVCVSGVLLMCVRLLFVFGRIYGPNTEIEWNKEGARGFSILARIPPQTAFAMVVDKAAQYVKMMNSKLDSPETTTRGVSMVRSGGDNNNVRNLVTSDPVSSFRKTVCVYTPDSNLFVCM